MRSVIGDVIFGVAMILIVGIGMLFLDRGDLRMADALDLMAVREVRMMRGGDVIVDRKSTRLNSSHSQQSRMPSSA